uniref:F-box domain-containing protein n=1 Tax=Oryza punctata TaxID=4537 RepID=A0A0E0MAK0_ORYPU
MVHFASFHFPSPAQHDSYACIDKSPRVAPPPPRLRRRRARTGDGRRFPTSGRSYFLLPSFSVFGATCTHQWSRLTPGAGGLSSARAQHEGMMSLLPEDVLANILYRLAPRFLTISRSVCKP